MGAELWQCTTRERFDLKPSRSPPHQYGIVFFSPSIKLPSCTQNHSLISSHSALMDGDQRTSVDRYRNQYNTPKIPANESFENTMRQFQKHPAILLPQEHGNIILLDLLVFSHLLSRVLPSLLTKSVLYEILCLVRSDGSARASKCEKTRRSSQTNAHTKLSISKYLTRDSKCVEPLERCLLSKPLL